MAVVFSRRKDNTLYEIRRAGRSVRLYTNGVLHTQYHPAHGVTGGVWDLLALPALALPQVQRVLLLGVGGGAAIHLLRRWCPGVVITGVELNAVHLQLARQFFDLKGKGITLIHGDAKAYVEQYQGEPFDMVIEDLFAGNGDPVRTFDANRAWCMALGRLVSKQGAVVINTLSPAELRATAFVSDASVCKQWATGFSCTLPAYANTVGVFYRSALTPAALGKAVRADSLRARQERQGLLRYKIRTLRRNR